MIGVLHPRKLIRYVRSRRPLVLRTGLVGVAHACMRWVAVAQDVRSSGGVAAYYDLARGWTADYPETTGYLIPTCLAYAKAFSRDAFADRALRMGEWLTREIQLKDGSIRGGLADHPLESSVFNTGQVLHGFCALVRETKDPEFVDAAVRAGKWLLTCLDDDGAFRRGLVSCCTGESPAYFVRTAWAWARLWEELPEHEWAREAAEKAAHFVERTQLPSGWFPNSDLDNARKGDAPLLHPVAYVLEGLLEVGLACRRESAVSAVRLACDRMMAAVSPDGYLAGRLYADWSPAARWVCLPGSTQMAIVCFRLFQHTGDQRYRECGRRLLRYVASTVDLEGARESVGGVYGSTPLRAGGYLGGAMLNWGAKFLVDAILLDAHLDGGIPDYWGPAAR